jgi:hypothetical protein
MVSKNKKTGKPERLLSLEKGVAGSFQKFRFSRNMYIYLGDFASLPFL